MAAVEGDEYSNTVQKIFSQEIQGTGGIRYNLLPSLHSEYPLMVQVGISTVCNLNCPECYYPIFSRNSNYRAHFMNISLFERIINEVSTFPSSTILRFLGRGETLNHPNLAEFLRFARSKLGGPITLITNGHLLNEKRAVTLFDNGVDVVDVSMDALTAGTYQKVRGKRFRRLENNLRNFISLRNQRNATTKIMASFLIQPENYHEAENFREIWGQVVDKVIFRRYHSYAGKIPEKPCAEEPRHSCSALWNRISINEYGRITLCYIDWDETSILTDLNDPQVSILKTWQTYFPRVREQHLREEFPDLCKKCLTGWQAAHWNLPYELAIKKVMID